MGNDLNSRLGHTLKGMVPNRGRSATGFAGLAHRGEGQTQEKGQPELAAAEATNVEETAASGEEGGSPNLGAQEALEASAAPEAVQGGERPASGEGAAETAPSEPGVGVRGAAIPEGANQAGDKRRSANVVGALVEKLAAGILGEDDGQMARKTVTLDNQVATYIQERLLRESREAAEAKNKNRGQGQRVTLAGILREALKTELDAETGRRGKRILEGRHRQYGSSRTNLDIPESTMGAIRVEMNRYSTRDNLLTEAAVIELRIAAWVVSQPDWSPDAIETQA